MKFYSRGGLNGSQAPPSRLSDPLQGTSEPAAAKAVAKVTHRRIARGTNVGEDWSWRLS